MHIHDLTKEDKTVALACAAQTLQSGGLVVYPTETTYGIACDVENPQAVQKLLEYKGKRLNKAISVAVSDAQMADRYVERNNVAKNLYEQYLPGPVTVVSKGTGLCAPGIANLQGGVGIRISSHPIAQELTRAFGGGISATGANVSNAKRPYSIKELFDYLPKRSESFIDCILDAGTLPPNEPSTVIDTTLDDLTILRQGNISFSLSKQFVTHSVEETIADFQNIATQYRSYYTYKPVLFLFEGEMGAGKTHAIKGIAKELGIQEMITSPTYTFANEYVFQNEGRDGLFVHMDCWRMQSFDEVLDLGFEDYLQKNTVLAIEWSELFAKEFQSYKERARIVCCHIRPFGDTREITIGEL